MVRLMLLTVTAAWCIYTSILVRLELWPAQQGPGLENKRAAIETHTRVLVQHMGTHTHGHDLTLQGLFVHSAASLVLPGPPQHSLQQKTNPHYRPQATAGVISSPIHTETLHSQQIYMCTEP